MVKEAKSASFRKNDLVMLVDKDDGNYLARRPPTREETQAWHDSDASKGWDSAGETKLAPRVTLVRLDRAQQFTVLKARCRVEMDWRIFAGMTKIKDPVSGEEVYVPRAHLRKV